MNLKRVFDWHCLAERIGSSFKCAVILDAEKKETHPSEKLFTRALSHCLEITPCIPSREEAQTSSSQCTQTPNVRTILLSWLNIVFFHPSQWDCFFLPFGTNWTCPRAVIFTKLWFICSLYNQNSADEVMTALNMALYQCSHDSIIAQEQVQLSVCGSGWRKTHSHGKWREGGSS